MGQGHWQGILERQQASGLRNSRVVTMFSFSFSSARYVFSRDSYVFSGDSYFFSVIHMLFWRFIFFFRDSYVFFQNLMFVSKFVCYFMQNVFLHVLFHYFYSYSIQHLHVAMYIHLQQHQQVRDSGLTYQVPVTPYAAHTQQTGSACNELCAHACVVAVHMLVLEIRSGRCTCTYLSAETTE